MLRIAVVSIALAIIVNILTLAIVRGFQQQVKAKINGFNAPLFISKAGSSHIFEAEPIDRRIPFLSEVSQIAGIQGIQAVGFKPILLQSKHFTDTINLNRGADTIVQRQELMGLMLKGVDSAYDWSFISQNIKKGRLINKNNLNEVMLSMSVAKKLNIKLNDEVSAFHIKQKPLLKKLKVVGLFDTGFSEYDQKLIFGHLELVQHLSDYGTRVSLRPELNGKSQFVIAVDVEGDASNLLFDWGLGKDIYTAHKFNVLYDTTLKVRAYRFDPSTSKTIFIDSASIQINAPGVLTYNDLKLENGSPICLVDGVNEQVFATQNGPLQFKCIDGIGTSKHFVSGFEVAIADFDALQRMEQDVKNVVEMRPVNQHLLQVTSIKNTEADLFAWLNFIDFNLLIIIFLMIVIGIINVGSAMLVIIVVRTSFVGLLKTLGANNQAVRRIFLYQAAYLLLRGLLIGNVIAVLFCVLQERFGLIKLNAEVYYLSAVPISLNIWSILFVNAITFVICMLALLLPSRVVARISPLKAIQFK